MKVAVVGAGVAGLVAAWNISKTCTVDLFEAETDLGGHTHTHVVLQGPDSGVGIDTGFITFNDVTYPHFIEWLAEFGLQGRVSDMSFGYSDEQSGFAYGGHNLDSFFARRSFLFNPDFLRFALEIARFNRLAAAALRQPARLGTLGEFAARFSPLFFRHYLSPLGSAIWSATPSQMAEFPAQTYLQFFRNHGLLSVLDRPTWRTVPGGSAQYVRAFESRFQGRVFRASPVESVRRQIGGVSIRSRGEWLDYDRVVLATHADRSLALLSDPDAQERELLGSWSYQANQAVLHTDTMALPALKKVRASWNYVRPRGGAELATLTYDMNRLQGLQTREHYLVTLNPVRPVRDDRVLGSWTYHHPQYTRRALASQPQLSGLQHHRQTYYCGSYFGFGFHEDAVVSALNLLPYFGASA